ncbi:MAG: hypothetical protein V1804_02425 [Patescibacteria group bacterium]
MTKEKRKITFFGNKESRQTKFSAKEKQKIKYLLLKKAEDKKL